MPCDSLLPGRLILWADCSVSKTYSGLPPVLNHLPTLCLCGMHIWRGTMWEMGCVSSHYHICLLFCVWRPILPVQGGIVAVLLWTILSILIYYTLLYLFPFSHALPCFFLLTLKSLQWPSLPNPVIFINSGRVGSLLLVVCVKTFWAQTVT